MAMKVIDLMVGDLVYVVRGYDKHLTIEKVKGIVADKDELYPVTISTGETVSLNDIKPIPLTEDILVKNGFERCDYNNKYFIIDDAIDLITPKWRGGTEYYACAWYQDEFDDLVQHIEICKCAYVHQLQHLLRLAGVQKEIEL